MLAASGWPKMPKTPHSSLNLSSMLSMAAHAARPSERSRPGCRLHRASASSTAQVDRDASPSTAIRSRSPAGPADDARRHAGAARRVAAPASRRSGATLTTTRDADSPKSAAASGSTPPSPTPTPAIDTSAPIAAGVEAALGERHREPAVGAVVRRPDQPRVGQRRPAARCSARSRARSSAGGTPAHQTVHDLQVLAAAELAATLAEQHDRRRPAAWNRRVDARDRRARAGRRRR